MSAGNSDQKVYVYAVFSSLKTEYEQTGVSEFWQCLDSLVNFCRFFPHSFGSFAQLCLVNFSQFLSRNFLPTGRWGKTTPNSNSFNVVGGGGYHGESQSSVTLGLPPPSLKIFSALVKIPNTWWTLQTLQGESLSCRKMRGGKAKGRYNSIPIFTGTLLGRSEKEFQKGVLGGTCLVIPGTFPFACTTDKEHPKELQHETPFPTFPNTLNVRKRSVTKGVCTVYQAHVPRHVPIYLQNSKGRPLGTSTWNALSGTPFLNARFVTQGFFHLRRSWKGACFRNALSQKHTFGQGLFASPPVRSFQGRCKSMFVDFSFS